MLTITFTIEDPFVGVFEVSAETLEAAIENAYQYVLPENRPRHIWWHKGDERIEVPVPGGTCKPVF